MAELVTLHQQIECAKRELAMRRRVYPKWVSAGRMKQEKAAHEIRAMEAILTTLLKVYNNELEPNNAIRA